MEQLDFADNIARLRREQGITQEVLADFIGVTKASVSKWETGQSLPDIQTLLLLASYFGVTLDELLGYRPELSREQIRCLYRELAGEFAEKPFEEAFARSKRLVRAYYSCYPFLLQIGVLWLNHYMLAASGRQVEVLEEAAALCARIYENSRDSGLCSDAVVLEAAVRLAQNRTQEVIGTLEEVCNPYRMSRSGDLMLVRAYLQAGDAEKADARVQLCMFEASVVLLSGAVNYLNLHQQEADKCGRLLERMDVMLEQGGLAKLHPNAAAQYEYYAAVALCVQGSCEEGAARLMRFAQLVSKMKRDGMKLRGDELFDRLGEWIEQNELGADPPRSEGVVLQSAVQA
ncbi:MAG: helix-turn-helix domain-containing protein, partial [Lachnospiraceae bacterium]|nr:helix-turn-helix domain-containing protein [Lachnospiraceae bacterium]